MTARGTRGRRARARVDLIKASRLKIPVLIVEPDIDRVPAFPAASGDESKAVLMAGTPDEVRADRRVQESTPAPAAAGRGPCGRSCARRRRCCAASASTLLRQEPHPDDATLDVRVGEIVALLGRNGAASPAAEDAGRARTPVSGCIEYDGRDIAGMAAPDLARRGSATCRRAAACRRP